MIAEWAAQIRAWGMLYNRVRPTAAGVWYLLITVGVAVGAMNTGNNLVYAVLSLLMAILVVNNVLAEWNLRGVTARRILPTELFAGEPARGTLIVENPRRVGPAFAVRVTELDGGRAEAEIARVAPLSSGSQAADWRFDRRGDQTFNRLRVGSSYPFGLLLRYRDLDSPGSVLVYPQPARGSTTAGHAGEGVEAQNTRGQPDQTGEFQGLRPYAPGDPVRRIHGPSSAKTGVPMVMLRAGQAGSRVWLQVHGDGEAREHMVRQATHQVLAHSARGDAVGLEVGAVRIEPSVGTQHRRALLGALALA